MVKKRACIFISGTGSNLKSIIKYSRDYNFPINVALVVSNKKEANGINFAKKFSIPYRIFNLNKYGFEKAAIKELRERKIDLLCLAGFMKVLTKNFIRSFRGKIINIHPSLLPKYKGLNTHLKAIKNKDKYSGCTVHFVNSKLDSGKIILQKKIKVLKSDNKNSLSKRVLKIENLIYPKAINKFISSIL